MGKPDFVFEDSPGWEYFVEEVSLSVYKVRAEDESGRTIEITGFDEKELVERLHQEVIQIIAGSADRKT